MRLRAEAREDCMGSDRESLYKRSMEQARELKLGLTRRRMLQISAAAAAAAGVGIVPKWARSAETHGPGWYTDESLKGQVVVYSFSGQRWGLPCEGVIPTFKERFPNVEVKVISEPVGEAYTKMQVYAASKSNTYNAAICDHNIMPAIGQIGAPKSLEEWLAADKGWADDYFKDVPPNITIGYRYPQQAEGATSALACDSNTKLMFYRMDKFKEAGISKLPETWNEAIEIAKALHNPDKDIYGFVTTGRRGLFAGLELYQMIRSYGGTWFDDKWEPQFNTEIGHKAFDTLLRLMQYRHPVTLNAADDEANAVLAKGSAVFAPLEWGTSVLQDPQFTEFAGVFGAAVIPKGEGDAGRHNPLMGGFGYYVNNFGNDQKAAFEYVKHLNSAEYVDTRIGHDYVAAAGQPARTSLLRAYADEKPYYSALADSIPICTPGFPWVPEAFTLADTLGNDVAAVIAGEKDMEKALKDIDAAQRQIMQDSGYYD
jgi:sorbitol/mannitol transport system substrate-binding protein